VAVDEYATIDFPGCMELTRIFEQLHPDFQPGRDPWWIYPSEVIPRVTTHSPRWGPQWRVPDQA
jgi:hypothetical protein